LINAYNCCALVTALSALVSLGFSVAALATEQGRARTIALYAAARSLAYAVIAAVPLALRLPLWLQAAAVGMIIVQGADALIGLTLSDRLKTLGPALTALVNAAALIWLTAS
jgi:hypothetical protein